MGGDMKESLLDLAGDEAESSLEKKIWISQSFMGHIGSTHLAAYALVLTVLFGFVLGIQLGMVGGVGTLCGQAYGAKQYEKLGIYLQQSCIILLVVCILVTPLFVFAAPVLKALGQDHSIADMAGDVAPWFIAVVFLYGAMYGCNAYLQSQSKNFILSCYAIVSLLVHVLLSWFLVVKLEFGVSGVIIEFCYNLILILLTGKMENAEVAIDALSICLIITGWTTVVSGGFLSAVSVRVSNELGRKDTIAAKFSIVTTLVMSVSIGAC
ncbi:hypothetical protein SASPL_157733 [Salvia splendens]|uniref:Multidrug resistance protein, MATE family n=1 Tax=Salvia splendens TaxID=180675 RepID=A0A8X8VUH0_SALSN|nr:hypothetical protein SASPL_157733 [Salvia splendens]